jgi:predicted sugar kinase
MKYIVQNHVEEITNDEEFVFPVQSIGGSAAAGLFGNGMVIIAGEAIVIDSMEISSDYDVIFGVPQDYIPRDSQDLMVDEADNFEAFGSTGQTYSREIAYRVLHECLPEIKLGKLTSLGNLIYDYRFDMGSIKNCSFCYKGLVELGDNLRVIKTSGLAEVIALSSVGPGFFAITKNKDEVVKVFKRNNLKVFETKCYNYGYTVI